MTRENVTIRNVDKKLWFKFVAKVKTEKKRIPEVLEKMLEKYIKGQ